VVKGNDVAPTVCKLCMYPTLLLPRRLIMVVAAACSVCNKWYCNYRHRYDQQFFGNPASPVMSEQKGILDYIHIHTHTYLCGGEPGLAGSRLKPCLTPSHHVLLRQEKEKKGWRWRKRSEGKVYFMSGNCCRDFEARCPSSRQPVLKTSTKTDPCFSHKRERLLTEGTSMPFMTALRHQ